ncbi:MAG: cyclase family protein [Armatimonadota bacterium]|nr:cyclase [Armatimonadota bacterium]
MKIYDITAGIDKNMPVYPGDPHPSITPESRISNKESSNISLICISTHTGTHIDPPYHMIEDGGRLDTVPLENLTGPCIVCQMLHDEISAADLEDAEIPAGTERILFKTKNSDFWAENRFREDYTSLKPDAAEWLVAKGVKLVGIDYLSVEKMHSGTHPVHMRLLGAGVTVVEGLDLRDVPSGIYTLVCLPLKIIGGDGGPARAILIK